MISPFTSNGTRMPQAAALLLSLLTEAPAAALVTRGLRWGSAPRAAVAAVLGTCATHPVLWEVLWELIPDLGYWPAVAIGEAGVVAIEALFYGLLLPLSWGRALAVSAAANAASFGAGLAIAVLR